MVERRAAEGPMAHLDVEQRADDLSLAVIAHRGVRGVLIGAIEFYPRVETCIFECVKRFPGSLIEVRDLARQVVEVLFEGAKTRKGEDAPVVVARGPLEPPKRSRVALFLVVVGRQPGWSDALDVPRMKGLVRDQRKKVEVCVASVERAR